jgi:hypothetical protein
VSETAGGVLKRSLRRSPLGCTVGVILPDLITPQPGEKVSSGWEEAPAPGGARARPSVAPASGCAAHGASTARASTARRGGRGTPECSPVLSAGC